MGREDGVETNCPCQGNYRCVLGWAVCYGRDHCRDNSGEENCGMKSMSLVIGRG